ncbi:MAG: T9SS type A sorting domain-containing protein [Saprospiraceae bacterium]
MPVPASTVLNLEVESTTNQTAMLAIYDIRGALVQTREIDLVEGLNTFSFEVGELSDGVHVVRIPGLEVSQRFIKAGN